MEERLQKLLARAGLGSRRACEEFILAGRVTVNGQRAELGSKADPDKDKISVDGRPLQFPAANTYIALYKPRGVLSTVSAPDPRPTVRDLVPVPAQIYPVGRLDVDSEGLILLTDDGELANRLTHPRYGHEKEYRVLVARRPDAEQLESWRRGVVLSDGYKTEPAQVMVDGNFGKGAWLRIILKEGRKRQIRETGSLLGLPVVRIIRVRIGSLLLGSLKAREWRPLTEVEVAGLKGRSKPGSPGTKGRPRSANPRGTGDRPRAGDRRRVGERPQAGGRSRSDERSQAGGRSRSGERSNSGERSRSGEGSKSGGDRRTGGSSDWRDDNGQPRAGSKPGSSNAQAGQRRPRPRPTSPSKRTERRKRK